MAHPLSLFYIPIFPYTLTPIEVRSLFVILYNNYAAFFLYFLQELKKLNSNLLQMAADMSIHIHKIRIEDKGLLDMDNDSILVRETHSPAKSNPKVGYIPAQLRD